MQLLHSPISVYSGNNELPSVGDDDGERIGVDVVNLIILSLNEMK